MTIRGRAPAFGCRSWGSDRRVVGNNGCAANFGCRQLRRWGNAVAAVARRGSLILGAIIPMSTATTTSTRTAPLSAAVRGRGGPFRLAAAVNATLGPHQTRRSTRTAASTSGIGRRQRSPGFLAIDPGRHHARASSPPAAAILSPARTSDADPMKDSSSQRFALSSPIAAPVDARPAAAPKKPVAAARRPPRPGRPPWRAPPAGRLSTPPEARHLSWARRGTSRGRCATRRANARPRDDIARQLSADLGVEMNTCGAVQRVHRAWQRQDLRRRRGYRSRRSGACRRIQQPVSRSQRASRGAKLSPVRTSTAPTKIGARAGTTLRSRRAGISPNAALAFAHERSVSALQTAGSRRAGTCRARDRRAQSKAISPSRRR